VIKGNIHIRSGELVFIRDENDFVQLIERELGYDAAQMVQQLVGMAENAQQLQKELEEAEDEILRLRDEFSAKHSG